MPAPNRIRDPERRAAGLLCIGFPGPEPDAEFRALLDRGVRAVILFARNATSIPDARRLTDRLRAATPERLLVAIDQEGGSVRRLTEGTAAIPSMRDVGATGDPARAAEVGALLARDLRAAGIDLDLAPVLDVDSNPANPVIGPRAFSADPDRVAAMGAALIAALQVGGVAACGKHFPGHGDADVDSHHDLPVLRHDRDRLERIELPPFRAAIAADVAAIMTAHVLLPALDATRPATLSPAIVAGLLRRDLGYAGVVISDDLEMEAIAGRLGIGEAAVAAVAAGVDLLLVCHEAERQHAALDALAAAIRDGTIPAPRVAAALHRIDALLARVPPPDPAPAG